MMSDGHEVTVFAPKKSHERLIRTIPILTGVRVVDFSTKTLPVNLRKDVLTAVEWIHRLPDVQSFDVVYCDNLPEILIVRPDARLMAQFFWHEVIDEVNPEYIALCRSLLSNKRPHVLGCRLFTMDHVRKCHGFQYGRMVENPHLVTAARTLRERQRTDLLITGGSTNEAIRELQRAVSRIMENGLRIGGGIVNVDPQLLPTDTPEWIRPASFDTEMFLGLKAAICRPGLGVVTDLLTVGIVPVPHHEDGNSEMLHNAKIVNSIYAKMSRLCGKEDPTRESLEGLLNRDSGGSET